MEPQDNIPLVSVIVPNFNHGIYLQQALDSLAKQTYPNIEIVFIDDGSTDNSKDVVFQWQQNNKHPKFEALFEWENKGKWYVLNKAIAHASGPIITTLDSDDYSCEQRIERQLSAMLGAESYHNLCLYTDCYSQQDIDSNKLYVSVNNEIPIMSHEAVLQHVYAGVVTEKINHYYTGVDHQAHGASSMFYKNIWQHGIRFQPGNMGLRCCPGEDSDFNTRMTLLLQKTSILLEPQYLYRRNTSTNNSWTEL